MPVFDAYLQTIQEEKHREIMRKVLQFVQDTFPMLDKQIKWSQPMFVMDGTFIISFSAAKQHFSLSPEKKALDHFEQEMRDRGYTFGSMLMRVKWTEDIPYDLIERMVAYNMKDKQGMKTFWRKAEG